MTIVSLFKNVDTNKMWAQDISEPTLKCYPFIHPSTQQAFVESLQWPSMSLRMVFRDDPTRPHTFKKFKVHRQFNQPLIDREVSALNAAKGTEWMCTEQSLGWGKEGQRAEAPLKS